MDTKKPVPLPPSLTDLPRFGTTSTSSSSRKENERKDVAVGVTSTDSLVEKLKGGFANAPKKFK
jgi:hypothetical protein